MHCCCMRYTAGVDGLADWYQLPMQRPRSHTLYYIYMAPSKKAPSKAPAMKAPVWNDRVVTLVSAKRKDLSKADLRLFRGLAMLAEATVVAWEENDVALG